MKKLIVFMVLVAGCHGPVHNPVHYGHTGPVDYETMVLIHKGLQQAAFNRQYIQIEEEQHE